jgi:hypothetical protein
VRKRGTYTELLCDEFPTGNASFTANTLISAVLLRRLLFEQIITRPYGLKQMICSNAMLAKLVKSAYRFR